MQALPFFCQSDCVEALLCLPPFGALCSDEWIEERFACDLKRDAVLPLIQKGLPGVPDEGDSPDGMHDVHIESLSLTYMQCQYAGHAGHREFASDPLVISR